VIYRDPNFTAGEIVGYAPVYKGTNLGVKVTIDAAKVGEQSMLWPVLQVDGGLQNIFEWGYNGRQFSDPPCSRRGSMCQPLLARGPTTQYNLEQVNRLGSAASARQNGGQRSA